MRRQRAGPLLDSLHAWLNEVQLQVAPKSAIAKAIAYALNRWQALILYLQEGRLSIDNNPVERALRGVAIGRKNYLFAGNDAGGEREAALLHRHRDLQAQWDRALRVSLRCPRQAPHLAQQAPQRTPPLEQE